MEALARAQAHTYDVTLAPAVPGIYAIYARDTEVASTLGLETANDSGLLYVGKAEASLRSRLRDHHGFNGNSTFRVAMIAALKDVLGLGEVCPRFETRQPRATSFGKRPRYADFRLVDEDDEQRLTDWLQSESLVAFLPASSIKGLEDSSLEHLENYLMAEWRPLLNLRGNWAGGNAAVLDRKRRNLTASARTWHERLGPSAAATQQSRSTPTRMDPPQEVRPRASGAARYRRPAAAGRGLGEVRSNLRQLRKVAQDAYAKYGADPQGWSLDRYLEAIDELDQVIKEAERVPAATRARWEAEKRARSKAQPLYFRGRVRISTGGLGFYKSKVGDKGAEWNSTELSEAANTLAAGPLVTIYRATAQVAGISQ